MRTLKTLAIALALLPALDAAAMPKPYTAHYDVLRNGQRLGEATVVFKSMGEGRAEFSSSMAGTEGLAALAGANVEERSVLRWHEGVPETISWDYRQKAAWKTRERSLRVDAGARRIEGRDRDQHYAPPYRPGVLDRNAVTIALMQDLVAGRSGDLRYPVPDKNEVATWLFRTGASERMKTPMGAQRALRVERIRESAGGRSTTLWLAQERNYVPLRILQKEPDGETIDMRIISLR